MVTNHWNSPAIIMWDIFNEGQGEAGSGNGVGQTNTAYLVQLGEDARPVAVWSTRPAAAVISGLAMFWTTP